jgi:hypothetical protein
VMISGNSIGGFILVSNIFIWLQSSSNLMAQSSIMWGCISMGDALGESNPVVSTSSAIII